MPVTPDADCPSRFHRLFRLGARPAFAEAFPVEAKSLRRPGMRLAGGLPDDARQEREQADIRIAIVLVANLYFLIGRQHGLITPAVGDQLFWLFAGSLAFSVLARASLWLWPRRLHSRRGLAILFDYGMLTTTLIIGGEPVAPLFAITIWVTVGYGMRYGQRYLFVATIASLASVAVLGIFSAFWSQHPHLVGMLFLTALVVPIYAHLLLRGTRRSRDAAMAADLAKSRFLAQASHDLRQPIHAISLFTACLREERLTRDQATMVDNIDRSLNGVSRLFRSLLDVSRLDSGKVEPSLEVVDLESLLRAVVAQNSIAAQRARVDIRLVPTRARVLTDRALLEAMLQNLVSNALKYAAGRPLLIGCRRRGSTLGVWVVDRGAGIAESELSNVFVEFYRIPQPGRDVEGIGLGLAIVRRISALLNLRTVLVSKPGSGTSARIEGLRLVEGAAASTAAAPRQAALTQPLDGLRILLIEDNMEVLTATWLILERWGCLVQAEASPVFEIRATDIILSDFDLDDALTGIDAIRTVRAALGEDVPAILMTGHDEGRVQGAALAGDVPVMSKPLKPAELRSALLTLRSRARGGA